jgi:hypothetical protein
VSLDFSRDAVLSDRRHPLKIVHLALRHAGAEGTLTIYSPTDAATPGSRSPSPVNGLLTNTA